MKSLQFDKETDCTHSPTYVQEQQRPDPSLRLAYKAGIHALATRKADFASSIIPDGMDARNEFLMDFVEGYMDAFAAWDNEPDEKMKDLWNELPTGCAGCEFTDRCYVMGTGKRGEGGYIFIY